MLEDLADVLGEIRHWTGISEPKPGIFYLGRVAFLHFHLQQERRWADVRSGADWGPSIDVSIGASGAAKKALLRKLRRCYEKTVGARSRK